MQAFARASALARETASRSAEKEDIKRSGGERGDGSDDGPAGQRHIMIPAGAPWFA
jgi:hypothetical protein